MLGAVGALIVSSCAEGSPAKPATQFDPPLAAVEPACGNGHPDPEEQCDCEKFNGNPVESCPVTNINMNCASLMYTSGQLLCRRCMFDTSMCQGGVGPGGSGGGGTGR
jgi:hypothetical protein